MYGKSEGVAATWSPTGAARQAVLRYQVWTSGRDGGIRQMEDSFRLMRTQRMDLMQCTTARPAGAREDPARWKRGSHRYVGITHYHDGAHAELEKIVKTREWDFVQFIIRWRNARRRRGWAAGLPPTRAPRSSSPAVFAGGPVSQGQRQAAAAWPRTSTAELGAILPQVPCRESRRHVRHPRYRRATI